MKERPRDIAVTASVQQPGLDERHRGTAGEIRQKRSDTRTLGLRAFEKISAIEGIRLTDEMRNDLKSLDAGQMEEGECSQFIASKYGKS